MIVENASVPFDKRVWREAESLTRAGYAVSVISPVGPGDWSRHEVRDGVEIYRHPVPPSASSAIGYVLEYTVALFWELRLAGSLSRRTRFDVVHVCNPPDVLAAVAMVNRCIAGSAVVFDHHDLSPELFVAKFRRKGVLFELLKLAERATFAAADIVLSTNESYHQIALTRGGKRPDCVFVVRNGPRRREFGVKAPRNDLRRGRRYLVGYVGLMAEQDGLDLLIDAVQQVVFGLNRHDVQFLVIGDGPMRSGVQERAAVLGLGEYVDFPGLVRGERLHEMFSSMDICVGPEPKNDYNDASTMVKTVEAMAFGKPFVQFDLVEGRHTAGDSSLYATPNSTDDFGEKIVALLDDAPRRREMSESALEAFRSRLAWECQEPALLAAYARAISVSARRQARRQMLRRSALILGGAGRRLTKLR